MSGILKDENDIMVIDTTTSMRIYGGLFALMIGFGNFVVFLDNIYNNQYMFPEVLRLLFGGLIFWVGLNALLADTRIIIDKKSQSVIIKSKPIKEIPFSDINYVGINHVISGTSSVDDSYYEAWIIELTTTQGYKKIYETSRESDAVKIAKKIGRLTDKEIILPSP